MLKIKDDVDLKELEKFGLYKDMITGVKECFKRQELGLIKEIKVTQEGRIRV